jgi:WD40 domain-containing protein
MASGAELIERAPAEGLITSVAIAPDGNAIAIGTYADPARVYWWHWNGRQGSWTFPTFHISALGWEGAATLLVGDRREMREPVARWWRLGERGRVISECRATPPHDARIRTQGHGIASIATLPDGKVVTGGVDATLAVWDGCKPVWLHSGACCYTDQPVTVTVQGDGFATTGEAIWRDDEHGYAPLGPRRWTPSPWRAAQAEPRAKAEGLRAYGEDCSAAFEPNGKIVVSGARPWTFSISGDVWKMRRDETVRLYTATAPDCSALVAATERRLIWVKSR